MSGAYHKENEAGFLPEEMMGIDVRKYDSNVLTTLEFTGFLECSFLTTFISYFSPLTAFAHFFNDTQNSIRQKNPSATYEEVSKIVSTMWESIDANTKLVC